MNVITTQGPAVSGQGPAAASDARRSPVRRTRLRDVVGLCVATVALIALVLVVFLAFNELPAPQKGQNVVALATSAFGVIGSIVGAYFGIRTASTAVDHVAGNTDPNQASRNV